MTAGYLYTRDYALNGNIPALCYGPISDNIHGFDERVSLSLCKRITAAIDIFIDAWCGIEKSRSSILQIADRDHHSVPAIISNKFSECSFNIRPWTLYSSAVTARISCGVHAVA